MKVLGILLVGSLASLAALGCDDDENCGAGEPCACRDTNECYLSCEGDGCAPLCHNTVHCGAVCQNQCQFECHDLNDCTGACNDDCRVSCHNTVSCGVICGERCSYDCRDTDRCGVRAGPGSNVTCANVTSCIVECEGSCTVDCMGSVNRCEISCLGGQTLSSCGGGLQACGACP